MISAKRLREVLHYSPSTGKFTWIVKTRKTIPGQRAGWTDKSGYLYIRIDWKLYAAARLVFLYMTGTWPIKGFVDHKNGNTSDNRWRNLRDVTKRGNQENRRGAGRHSKTGLLGASPAHGKFVAHITSYGKCYHLGTFATAEEAHAVYVKAKRKLHASCTI
jgi:hypothetical protein